MSPARAKTFADRLEPVVEHVEEDISHLPPAMAQEIYPGRIKGPFRMGLAFERFGGDNYSRAVALAKQATAYSETEVGDTLLHRAVFEPSLAREFFDLYRIVREVSTTRVIVNDVPLATTSQIWPLFFGILGGEWAWEPTQ